MTRVGNYNFFQYKPAIRQNRKPSFAMNREVSGFVLNELFIFRFSPGLRDLSEFLKAPKSFAQNDKEYGITANFASLFKDLQKQLAGYVKKAMDVDPKAICNLPMPSQRGVLAPYVKKEPDGTYVCKKLNKKETLEIANLMVKGTLIDRIDGFRSKKMDTALEAIKDVHVNDVVLTDKYYEKLAGVLEAIKESVLTNSRTENLRKQLAGAVKEAADSHPDGVFTHPINGGLHRITNKSDALMVADGLIEHSTMHPACSSLYLNTTEEKMRKTIEYTHGIYLR